MKNCKSRITDSAPKIDPKETVPKSKEDELDELLNLGSSKKSNMTSQMPSQMTIKRSDPKVYDFSEPINNLHEGKASSGKDFRSPTKKGLDCHPFNAHKMPPRNVFTGSAAHNSMTLGLGLEVIRV